jgi:hypothetical protein
MIPGEHPVNTPRNRRIFGQSVDGVSECLTPLGRSAALLIGTLSRDGGFTLMITAATRRPIRLTFPALPPSAALRDRIRGSIPDAQYFDDLHGAPAWRKHMTLQLAEEIRRELSPGATP